MLYILIIPAWIARMINDIKWKQIWQHEKLIHSLNSAENFQWHMTGTSRTFPDYHLFIGYDCAVIRTCRSLLIHNAHSATPSFGSPAGARRRGFVSLSIVGSEKRETLFIFWILNLRRCQINGFNFSLSQWNQLLNAALSRFRCFHCPNGV